ncbi:hypothetical protein MHO82_18205 [Vibrio sp. Of7-15]|uniref:toxin VasX n=1 Tax=Vibrio sp. Of7-15 TaxID=2724879 RepID=UPI001EF37676|nr:toxin VasX [Vibrio sp. Of7-15]MCG7498805.1 hypothetical protein [Vibrio sp. Of7-15]
MPLNIPIPKRVIQAGYARHEEKTPTTSSASEPVQETLPVEPKLEYRIEIACALSHYKQYTGSLTAFSLAKTDAEDALEQWHVEEIDGHTFLTLKVMEDEPKSLISQSRQLSYASMTLDEVQVHPTGSKIVNEAFVPVRPAVQVGEQLGLPTKGYYYHFLDGKLVHEYKLTNPEKWQFQLTHSRDGELSDDVESQELHHILALWKRNGTVVTDQYLLHTSEKLTPGQLSAVDSAFLEQNGVLLDMSKIIPLTGSETARFKHVVVDKDTLSEIAYDNGVKLTEAVKLNPSWKGTEDYIYPDNVIYLEPLKTYNHADDVYYPTTQKMLDNNVGVIVKKTVKDKTPFVTVTSQEGGQYLAISPVRYALDVLDENNEPRHPIEDKETFSGGFFQSLPVDYTLRQIRDGWLYVIYQADEESDEWQLDEYQINGIEYQRFVGKTAEERANAEPESPKSHLLYDSKKKHYFAYAVKRWTQRVCDHFLASEEHCQSWMRELDLSQPEAQHRSDISTIEQCVADVNKTDVEHFGLTCSPLAGDKEDNAYIKVKETQTEGAYRYQVPESCDHIVLALDDPFADLNDLYLRLLALTLSTVLDDENQRKVTIAETIRSMVRTPVSEEEMPDLSPEQWIEFEQNLDTYLYYHCHQEKMSKLPYYARMGREVDPAVVNILNAYPHAKSQLAAVGFRPTKKHLDHYKRNLKAYNQVEWQQLDAYYKDYLATQAEAQAQIPEAFDNLLDALKVLGPEPLERGLDIGEGSHMAYLFELVGETLLVLDTNANDESAHVKLFEAIEQETPDNLMATAHCFFSTELFFKGYEIAKENGLINTHGDWAALGGRWAEFGGVLGYGVKSDSLFYKATLKLLIPIDELVESTQEALKLGIESTYKKVMLAVIGRRHRGGGKQLGFNRELGLWAMAQVKEVSIHMNPDYEGKGRQFRVKLKKEIIKLSGLTYKQDNTPKHTPESQGIKDDIVKQEAKVANLVKEVPDAIESFNNQNLQLINKIGDAYNSLGGFGTIVAVLNLMNVADAQGTFIKALNTVPGEDKAAAHRVYVSAVSWSINATGDVFRGMTFDLVKNDSDLMRRSLSRVLTNNNISLDKKIIAKSYVSRSLLTGATGFIAAGLEGWQTWKDFEDADFALEKGLLFAKTIALGGQALIWGWMSLASCLNKLGIGSLRVIFQPWMASGLFWLGIVYLVTTVLLNYFAKTPLEQWLRKSIWGKENKGWSALEEYENLLKIMMKPQISTTKVDQRLLGTPQHAQAIPALTEYKQQVRLRFPQLREGQPVALAIQLHRESKPESYATPSSTLVMPVSKEIMAQQGKWELTKEGVREYVFTFPEWLKSGDNIVVTLGIKADTPYEGEQKSTVLYYNFKLQVGDTMEELSPMHDLDASSPKIVSSNDEVILTCPL